MKRILLYTAGFILLTCAFTSCDVLGGGCEICALVARDSNGDFDHNLMEETEYCDEELLQIKAYPDYTEDGLNIGWECH